MQKDYIVRCGYCGRYIYYSESYGDYFMGRKCRECYEEMLRREK